MKLGNLVLRIKAEKVKVERCLALSVILSRGWSDIFIYLYFVDIEISLRVRDWMLPNPDEDLTIDGRLYKSYKKNPKYENDKLFTFMFPRK